MCLEKANPPSKGFITNSIPLVGLPTDADIICGRGRGVWTHPGNLKFKLLIEHNLQAYAQAERRKEKSLIINHVLDTMMLSGARFVKKERSVWYVIDEKEAREKTAHAMRDFLKRRRQEQGQEHINDKKRKRDKQEQSPPDWTNFEPSMHSMKRSLSEPQAALSRSFFDFKLSSSDGEENNATPNFFVSLSRSKSLSDLNKAMDLEPLAIFSSTMTALNDQAPMPIRSDWDDERLRLFNKESADPLQNLFGSTSTDEPNLDLKSLELDDSSGNFNFPDFC